ncbi:beta-N-acetylhexosaminidase [Salinisphaera sp. Q1T1-3]|nr:beta-N-acetylhexosaminidase [Salinisphaera sp. Q1T1-3]
MVDVAGTSLTADDRELLADPTVGGVILFARNFADREQLAALTADMRVARPNLLIVADYEGGRVQRFTQGFTRIPPMAALGARHERDPAAARDAAHTLGWLVAFELADVGIDMPLAPVLDRDYGHSTVIGHRALARDPAAIAALGTAYAEGLAAGGSAATAKHFPGHGWVHADSHAELPVDTRDREALAADWAPFAALVSADIPSMMMAHVRYPAVDTTPASLSSVWIADMLRGELGFSGCVFCDDLSMGGPAAVGDYATRCRAALTAGCDYLPVCNDRASALIARDAVHDSRALGQPRRVALNARLAAHRERAVAADDTRLADARRLAEELNTP